MRVARYLIIVCMLASWLCPNVEADGVSFNVFLRVLMIKTPSGLGTGFTFDVDGRQYLITAKHMVTGLKPEDTIEIKKYDGAHQLKWVTLDVKVFKCDDPVDIAVLIPPEQLTVSMTLEVPTADNPVFGQDVFFVGFPEGTSSEAEFTFPTPFPLGLVKRAVVSGVRSKKVGDAKSTQFILDGYNIGGFSGSPVVYRPGNGGGELKVVAVISGFRADQAPVLTPKEIKPEQATPEDYGRARVMVKDGHTFRLEESHDVRDQRYVILNTGIITAYELQPAIELIHQHPEGPKTALGFAPPLAQ